MNDHTKDYKKWLSILNGISENYPFGPIEIKRNEVGQMHCSDSPAYISPTRIIWYNNGRKHGIDVDIFGSIAYFYEDILVPNEYMVHPESLTFKDVISHPNTEIRYVGMKIIGFNKIKEECETVDEDERGYELFKIKGVFEESIMVLKCLNSTPEIDGNRKIYYLLVPPTMKTCQEAVAWTFMMEPSEYHPEIES